MSADAQEHGGVTGRATEDAPSSWADALEGLLLGTAVGDSIGLPYEGLKARTPGKHAVRPLHHAFLFGRGMVSDDTEHAWLVVQAWLASGGDQRRFERSLARRLRLWLLCLPAGTGSATARAILKLWVGFPPARSGVRSAGNGPAMRAPVLGLLVGGDPNRLAGFVRASTLMTHTDSRAEQGAIAVAIAARISATAGTDISQFRDRVFPVITDCQLLTRLTVAVQGAEDGIEPTTLAEMLALDRGVTGFVNDTVPAAIYCWLRFPGDFRSAVTTAVRLGGDTDTVAAITGALCGAEGVASIPSDWIEGIWEWPRSVGWSHRLAQRAAAVVKGQSGRPLACFWPAIPIRNLLFLLIVLAHGLRRLVAPPNPW